MRLYGLLVDDKSIGDGTVLFLGRIGVGGEGGAQGSLFGFLAHGLVDDGGAFGGYLGAGDLSRTIDPNIYNYNTLFGEIVVRTVQRFCTTTAQVVACSVAFAAVTVILPDAFHSIGFALVAGLPCDAFRTTSLWTVAALEQGPVIDFRLGAMIAAASLFMTPSQPKMISE